MGDLERFVVVGAVALVAGLGAQPAAAATFFFSNTPYRSEADIPAGFYAGGAPALLENFEDFSVHPSLSVNFGEIIGNIPNKLVSLTDSVDGDDGEVSGAKTRGHSWFHGNGQVGVSFTFNGTTLPTAFGIVWTDGFGTVTLSATAGDGSLLGSISRSGFADGSTAGTVFEDRFFGVTSERGIRSISIGNTSGGIEVDHVQYGSMVEPVPLPAAGWMMLTGLAGLLLRRRVG